MYAKTRAQGFGAEVKRRIMIGTYVLSHGYYDAYYLQAQHIRRLIAHDFSEAFGQCDVIMGPAAPSAAFDLGARSKRSGADVLADIYTIAVNLAGLPGMSIPCGFGARGTPGGAADRRQLFRRGAHARGRPRVPAGDRLARACAAGLRGRR